MALDQASSAPEANVFQEAMTSVTDTVKWIIATWGALAAFLLAGLSLSDLGRVEEGDTAKLAALVTVIAIALTAVGYIITAAARVLVISDTSLDKLAEQQIAKRAEPPPRNPRRPVHSVADHQDVLGYLARLRGEVQPTEPDLDLQKFYAEYVETLQKLDKLRRGEQVTVNGRTFGSGDTSLVTSLREEAEILRTRAALLQDAAQCYSVQRRYRNLQYKVIISGVIVVAAVITFALLTRPSGVPVTKPIKVQLKVTNSQAALREAGMAKDCAGQALSAVAVGGTLENPVVVTLARHGCPSTKVKFTEQLGRAVPK